jgi:hypothetical protein
MNIAMLKRLDGKPIRVRPIVQRRWHGERLEEMDQEWRVQIVGTGSLLLQLRSSRSGHIIDIYADGVQEYREPGFLVVKDQFTITEKGVEREPLPDRRLLYRDNSTTSRENE